jgi:putative lipoic acid-binding regulatory protein
MNEESALSFPCDLPIKVFGRNDDVFRSAALSIVRAQYGDAPRVSEQVSRQGSYLSLTITVRAESRAEIDAVYHALVASEHVLMVL